MIILSTALISSRLNLIPKVIKRVLEGSQLPDRIIINVSERGFHLDGGIERNDLRKTIDGWWIGALGSVASHLEIMANFVENIGPMRAYIPVIEMYKDKPNTTIIILDDDLGVTEHTIEDLLYWQDKLDCAVGIAGHTIGRGKYFFKSTIWSHIVKEPTKVHLHFAGWCTTFKIRHLHKSILDWKKYEHLGVRYDNEPYLAYMLAKQGTDRYVIPTEKLKIYDSPKKLYQSRKSQDVKEKQYMEFYKTISGDSIGLTGKEIIHIREE